MKIIFKIILSFVVLTSIASSVSGLEFKISPENPVVGDEITLTGTASPGDVLQPSITFRESVNVAKGNNKYEYLINGIEIPNGKSTFTVSAEKVRNLNVGVKLLIWWTKSADAINEKAVISQGGVPGGTYTVKMFGVAADGASSVPLTITASTKITADGKGNFKYEISTDRLTAGEYILRVGDITETITLLAPKEKQENHGIIEKQVNEDREYDRQDEGSGSTSVSGTPTPEKTEHNLEPTPAPEIKETQEQTPDHTPADVHESLFQQILKRFKFW